MTSAPGSVPGSPGNPENPEHRPRTVGHPSPAPHEALAAIAAGQDGGARPNAPSNKRKRRSKHKPDVRVRALNITSFLDMSFALLTFLILGANLSPPEGALTAKLPQGSSSPQVVVAKTPTMPLTLVVSEGAGSGNFVVSFDGMAVAPIADFNQLTTKLESLRYDPQTNPGGTIRPDNGVIIRPRSDVVWQGVMQAFNAVQRARYSKVAIAKAIQ